MKQRVCRQLVGLFSATLLIACAPQSLRADGGTVRVSETSTGYRITVFTSPTPLRAGPVDVSVFVQDAKTGDAIHDARVLIEAAAEDRSATVIRQPATTAAATNKLFQAAQFELSHSGRWQLQAMIEGDRGVATVNCTVDAAAAAPRTSDLWRWIAWPVIPVGLFIVHQFLKQQRTGITPRESRLSNRGTVRQ